MNPFFALLLLLLGNPQDGAELWKALDGKSADRLKEACGGDVARLVEAIRRGRPLGAAATGEIKERLTDAFGRETDLWIIVPGSYDATKPSGVFLALHGLGGTGAQVKDLWAPYAAAHNFIIAAPSAQKEPADQKNEDTFAGPGGRELPHWWSYREGDFPLSALSVLKRRYAIDENRVILTGYSMGGFGTWNLGLRYPDRFSALIPYAGGLSRAEYAGLRIDEKVRKLHLNSFNLPVFFVHGDADKTVPVEFDRESRNRLRALGYEYEYKEVPKGGHIMNVREGGEIMREIQKWLGERVRRPHPREVRHHAVGDYCTQSYWVRLEGFKDKAAEVRASIQGQTIDFTATGAGRVTFYLDETLLDLSKPVRVTSGGATLLEVEAKPSMDVVLETWRAREDRDLLYRAKVTVDVPK
jgi:predicted esterase